jgi:hypothetical protein
MCSPIADRGRPRAQALGERLVPQPLVIPELGRAKRVSVEQSQPLLGVEHRAKGLALCKGSLRKGSLRKESPCKGSPCKGSPCASLSVRVRTRLQ